MIDLGIDADELNSCVQCGLCLSSCPTFRVTGDETMSPRGRIALMREVQERGAPLTPEVVAAFDTCVQCRGCEPACPSGVPYGRLIERTREALVEQGLTPRWHRAALASLEHPRLLRLGASAAGLAQRAHLLPRRVTARLGLPPVDPRARRRSRNPRAHGSVYLFTGCVMDVLQGEVHLAAQRVLEAAGFEVVLTDTRAPCCGALHVHAGFTGDARRLAARMIDGLEPDLPVIVDSAGCGAAMKDYGHLLGTERAAAFAGRVFDIHEFLAAHLDALPVAPPLDLTVAIQDPCHLRHVQRVHEATRTVLRPYVRQFVELDDDGMCCGAGGAYAMLQPELAGLIRDRKVTAIERAAADVVASANPGCSMHLAATGVTTVHPIELVDRALRGRGQATE